MKKLTYLFLALLIVACSTDDNNNVDDTQVEWLYVHTAIEANATNSTTLVIPFTEDIFAFTDRPNREHKYISAEEFVSYWSEDATNSFQFDPPNAVFTSVSDDGVAEVEVVIVDASTDGDNITYTIQNPKLTENATFQDVSLFVDGNGEDSQPTPCNVVWLDYNGVTVRACDGAIAGEQGVLNGVIYTIVDKTMLADMIYYEEDVLASVCTSLITDMRELFYFETERNPMNQDISSWDVSNVTDMYSMFYNCYEFNQDIGYWDVSNVTNMNDMFSGAYVFNQDIDYWDVSNVTDMGGMFNQCSVIGDTNGNFNQNLSNWEVGGVLDCYEFSSCNPDWSKPQPPFNNCGFIFTIGQYYQGGIIIYIDSTGQHGLIADTEDLSLDIQWYDGTYILTGATGTAIGTGLINTNAIIAAQGSGSICIYGPMEQNECYAAQLCAGSTLVGADGGIYEDWFLPSKDELNQLFEHKTEIGGFGDNHYYLSSTEIDANNAWAQDFDDGNQAIADKSFPNAVRAVRTF